jgi:4-hydroxy-3-methylbut-2-enyl diphosphate reductase
MGQCEGGIHLVESSPTSSARVASRDALAYVTQTTLSVDDAAASSRR